MSIAEMLLVLLVGVIASTANSFLTLWAMGYFDRAGEPLDDFQTSISTKTSSDST